MNAPETRTVHARTATTSGYDVGRAGLETATNGLWVPSLRPRDQAKRIARSTNSPRRYCNGRTG